VVPLLEPAIKSGNPFYKTIFATTGEFKLGENIRLSATDALQSAILAVIGRWNIAIDLDSLRANPCGKEGSSLSGSGSGGFAAAPSMTLPLPVHGSGSAAGKISYSSPMGQMLAWKDPFRLASVNLASSRECY
jgi:hypothetical protein